MRLFDLHCDTLYECDKQNVSLAQNSLHVDLKRGLSYEAWAQVFAVWMPDTLRGASAVEHCLRVLRLAGRFAAEEPDRLALVDTADELDAALAGHKCAALLSVEGGSALGGRIETLSVLARLHVKSITLTWNGGNELGFGCGTGRREGLTPFGRQAVEEMERLGILPDVSHLNEAGFWDVMRTARGPVLATHSVSAGVYPHVRNLTDAQFRALCEQGGLVGLTVCRSQLGPAGAPEECPDVTLELLERHLEHYLSLGGERCVALGFDFDGTDIPEGWGGVEIMTAVREYLARKNYEDVLLERLFFSNCYDFFHGALTRPLPLG